MLREMERGRRGFIVVNDGNVRLTTKDAMSCHDSAKRMDNRNTHSGICIVPCIISGDFPYLFRKCRE